MDIVFFSLLDVFFDLINGLILDEDVFFNERICQKRRFFDFEERYIKKQFFLENVQEGEILYDVKILVGNVIVDLFDFFIDFENLSLDIKEIIEEMEYNIFVNFFKIMGYF